MLALFLLPCSRSWLRRTNKTKKFVVKEVTSHVSWHGTNRLSVYRNWSKIKASVMLLAPKLVA